jgi:hypothetical protein
MAALHADVADAPRLAAEDRLEELLQPLPFAGPATPKQPRELAVMLEPVVETVDDQADCVAPAECREQLGAGDRRRRFGGFAHDG